MAIGVHVHCKGGEDGNKVLKAMDAVGLERIVLMSRPALAEDRDIFREAGASEEVMERVFNRNALGWLGVVRS